MVSELVAVGFLGRRKRYAVHRPQNCRTYGVDDTSQQSTSLSLNNSQRQSAGNNLEAIMRLQRESILRMTKAERISDAISRFAGSQTFIMIHMLWFGLWILLNEGLVPGASIFDPFPFNLLTMVVSLEAILLTSFVLITQNRMGRQADKREYLDLQVNLLAEQEITKVLQMLDRICKALKIPEQDKETLRLMKETDVTSIAREIEHKIL